jgi:uncharacterized protein (DUF427 family)
MKAIWNNKVIAESDDTVVVESNHYFPIDSIKAEFFEKSDHTSICGWKGTASYYSINVGGKINENSAWYYSEPKEAAAQIKDRVAFWRGVKIEE